jgi:hypothetical protein
MFRPETFMSWHSHSHLWLPSMISLQDAMRLPPRAPHTQRGSDSLHPIPRSPLSHTIPLDSLWVHTLRRQGEVTVGLLKTLGKGFLLESELPNHKGL